MKISSLFSAFLIWGCAAHHQLPENLAPPTPEMLESHLDCRAKAELSIRKDRDRIAFEIQSRLRVEDSDSPRFDLFALSPIGTRIGRLQVSNEQSSWSDSQGERDLQTEALFTHWFNERWWQELALMHGQISVESVPFVQVTPDRSTLVYSYSGRSIICHDQRRGFVRSCQLKDVNLQTELNFTFLDCQ